MENSNEFNYEEAYPSESLIGTTSPEKTNEGVFIDLSIYKELVRLGILDSLVRSKNEGNSNYAKHIIQPWSIWIDWDLNPWDADIVKRVLRSKEGESRELDYKKIIHICKERLRQLKNQKDGEKH